MSPFVSSRGVSSPTNKWVFSDSRLRQSLVSGLDLAVSTIAWPVRGGHRHQVICPPAHGLVNDVDVRHDQFSAPPVVRQSCKVKS